MKKNFLSQASSYVRIFKRRLLINPESLSVSFLENKSRTTTKTSFLPSLSANKTAYYFYETSERTHEFSRPKICSPISLERFQSNIVAAAPVSVESTSSFGLKLLFSKVPSSEFASALNQQRAAAPGSVRSFQTTAMSAMSNKCVQLPFIAQRVSYHISELWNLLPSVKTKEEYATRAPFFSPIVYLNFCALSVVVFTKGGQKSGCLPACLFSRTSSC